MQVGNQRSRRTSIVSFRVREQLRHRCSKRPKRAFATPSDSGLSRTEHDDANLASLLALVTPGALLNREGLTRTAKAAQAQADMAHGQELEAQRELESCGAWRKSELANSAALAATRAEVLQALASHASAALLRFEISQQELEEAAAAAEAEATAEQQLAVASPAERREHRRGHLDGPTGAPLPPTAMERAETARALARSNYRMQGDLSTETPEAHRARQALQGDAEVQQWLNRFYLCFRSAAKSGAIARGEFITFSVRVAQCLLPEREFSAQYARALAESDWERDTQSFGGHGRRSMSKGEFFTSLFELVDLWTESIDRLEYVSFLATLYDRVTVRRADGLAGWRSTASFELLQEWRCAQQRQEHGRKQQRSTGRRQSLMQRLQSRGSNVCRAIQSAETQRAEQLHLAQTRTKQLRPGQARKAPVAQSHEQAKREKQRAQLRESGRRAARRRRAAESEAALPATSAAGVPRPGDALAANHRTTPAGFNTTSAHCDKGAGDDCAAEAAAGAPSLLVLSDSRRKKAPLFFSSFLP